MRANVDQLKSTLAAYRPMLILICVSAPSFMLQLDANIVAVSLPSISESLKANFAGIEWVVTAYTLSFASLLLPAGALADRFGRKRILVAGLSLFTIASWSRRERFRVSGLRYSSVPRWRHCRVHSRETHGPVPSPSGVPSLESEYPWGPSSAA